MFAHKLSHITYRYSESADFLPVFVITAFCSCKYITALCKHIAYRILVGNLLLGFKVAVRLCDLVSFGYRPQFIALAFDVPLGKCHSLRAVILRLHILLHAVVTVFFV